MVTMSASLPFDLGTERDLGDIVMHTGARLRVRVTDTAGTPMVGLGIALQHDAPAGTFEKAFSDDRPTDSSGVFAPRFRILPGTYRVVAGNEVVSSGQQLVVPIGVDAIEHEVVVRRHDEVER